MSLLEIGISFLLTPIVRSQTSHSRIWTVWHWLMQRYKLLLHYLHHSAWSVSFVSFQGSHHMLQFHFQWGRSLTLKLFLPYSMIKDQWIFETYLFTFLWQIYLFCCSTWLTDRDQPQALASQYKPLLPALNDRLFIFRNSTKQLFSVNWHAEVGSVEIIPFYDWMYLTKIWCYEMVFYCLT